jgi:co-chaperonin GroES (HSP10)
MESKYLEKFKRLQTEEAQALYRLQGARVLLEVLPQKEIKTAAGIILSAPKDHVKVTAESFQPQLAIVLLIGAGYVDSDNNPIDMDVKVGNIVMVNELGLRYFSTFPGIVDYTKNTLALTSESEIQMIFENMEKFEQYEAILNG